MADIERLVGEPDRAEAITGELMWEYLAWWRDRLAEDFGIVFDDPDAVMAMHHREFTKELPRLLGSRGRLLVARVDSEVVGVGALKPVDSDAAEIKRMYVRPSARGQGLGRAILERLIADARTIGYRVVRLETATFMNEAHGLYRSAGFRDGPRLDQPEADLSGLESLMIFMEMRLDHAPVS